MPLSVPQLPPVSMHLQTPHQAASAHALVPVANSDMLEGQEDGPVRSSALTLHHRLEHIFHALYSVVTAVPVCRSLPPPLPHNSPSFQFRAACSAGTFLRGSARAAWYLRLPTARPQVRDWLYRALSKS